jgi:peptide/nickel transport system substrate-binding protein
MRITRIVSLVLVALLIAPRPRRRTSPGRAGFLTWSTTGDPGRLDVHAESPLVVQQATAGIYSGLLHYDPDDPTKVVGDLAEKWTVSPDGKTYTFQLRKGVKWHDGQPFSSADVKATFDRILNPDFKSPKCGASLKPMVASVEAVDASTVTFQLKFAAAPFLPSVASAWCRIAAKHVLAKYGDLNAPEAQIGTGPFKFKKYERGSLIEWERNPDYFIKGLPYLDGVKQFILVAGPTQLAAAKASKVMMWDAWPPMRKTQADELQRARDDVDIYQAPINTMFVIFLNAAKAPFNNADLRRAVNLAIDRQELVAKALEGAGVPCAILDPKLVGDFALPLDEVAKAPGCRQPKEQDIAEAKKLVEKHHPGGLDIEIATRAVGNYVDRSQVVIAQLRKIGIRGTLKTHEERGRLRRLRQGRLHHHRHPGPRHGHQRALRHLPHRLYRRGGEQLRPAHRRQGGRAGRQGAARDQPGEAEGAVLGAPAPPLEPRGPRLHRGGLGGGLVLQGQEAARLQARRHRLRQQHLHEDLDRPLAGVGWPGGGPALSERASPPRARRSAA